MARDSRAQLGYRGQLRHGLPPPFPDGSTDVGARGADFYESEVEDSDEELTSADDRVSVDGESFSSPCRTYWDIFAPLARSAELFT